MLNDTPYLSLAVIKPIYLLYESTYSISVAKTAAPYSSRAAIFLMGEEDGIF